jgi:2-dehydropantoate 2-reductase
MKFAVFGAGAIGAYLGAKLHLAGEDVTLIARSQLPAYREKGVLVRSPDGDFQARPKAVATAAEVGPVDYVLLTVKAQSLTQIAPQIGPLLGPQTAVVSAQNGIPWWYFQKHGGPLDGTRLESVDPGGDIDKHIPAERIVACIVYPATEIIEPGVIQHLEGDRFSLGELDGAATDRTKALSRALIAAGLKAPVRPAIRRDLWVKLLGNMAFNPLSALSRATMAQIAGHAGTRDLARRMMEEGDTVARALGIEVPITVEQRLAGAEKVGGHKTSMLLDVEARRQTEAEAIVGAVVEVADKLGVPVPVTRTVYACVKLLDEVNTLR